MKSKKTKSKKTASKKIKAPNFFGLIAKSIALVFLSAALGYGAVCAWFYFNQEKILFHPHKIAADVKFDFKTPFDEIFIPVEGATLHGLYFKARTGSAGSCETKEAEMTEAGKASAAGDVEKHRRYRTTQPADGQNASTYTNSCGSGSLEPKGMILFFHGNTQTASEYGDTANEFTGQGFDYFVPDYRGFGKSTGKIKSEQQFLSDADAIWAWAAKKFPEEKISLAGRSMGGAPAAYLASKNKPRLTVLISTFFNIHAMADIRYPYLPKQLIRYQFRNDLWVTQTTSPIYFVHGTKDTAIPLNQSERLNALAKVPHRLFRVLDADHGHLQKFPLYHKILYHIMNPPNETESLPQSVEFGALLN